jgi:hypothetical protein
MTHKYKVESHRVFRGHPVSTGKPVELDLGHLVSDRTLIAHAKRALGWAGVKTSKQDLGDVIVLKPTAANSNTQLSITFCS